MSFDKKKISALINFFTGSNYYFNRLPLISSQIIYLVCSLSFLTTAPAYRSSGHVLSFSSLYSNSQVDHLPLLNINGCFFTV